MTDIESVLKGAARRPAPGAAQAAARFETSAAESGAADVVYAIVDSPLGPLTAATTRRGLVTLSYQREPDVLEEIAHRISVRILHAPKHLDGVRRELEEYFDGRRKAFDLALDWSLAAPGFTRRVLRATARIPYGATLTYKDVAARAGNERAARAAGNALGSNPIPVVVPCHRVLHSGGGLGGYTGGLEKKRHLLSLEGALS